MIRDDPTTVRPPSPVRSESDGSRHAGQVAEPGPKPPPTGWKRYLFFLLSGVFFGFAIIGALLPAIPATPFLLLTSYFLVRTSPRLNEKLLRSRFVGPILVDWQVNGGVSRGVKWKAVAMVLVALSSSIYLTGFAIWPMIGLVSLAAIGITVILRLPIAKVRH